MISWHEMACSSSLHLSHIRRYDLSHDATWVASQMVLFLSETADMSVLGTIKSIIFLSKRCNYAKRFSTATLDWGHVLLLLRFAVCRIITGTLQNRGAFSKLIVLLLREASRCIFSFFTVAWKKCFLTRYILTHFEFLNFQLAFQYYTR